MSTTTPPRRNKKRSKTKPEVPPGIPSDEAIAAHALDSGNGSPAHAPDSDWDRWTDYLSRRQVFRPWPDADPRGDRRPIWFWGLPDDDTVAELGRLCSALERIAGAGLGQRCEQRRRNERGASLADPHGSPETDNDVSDRFNRFLDRSNAEPRAASLRIEALVWASASPSLAKRLGAERWHALMAALNRLGAEDWNVSAVRDPWPYFLACELRLLVAMLYPEIAAYAAEWSAARDALSHGVCEWTDGKGWRFASYVKWLRPVLACWARCRSLADARGEPCFHREARRQFGLSVRQAMALSRPDGTPVFGDGRSWSLDRPFLQTLLHATRDRTAQCLVDTAFTDKPSGRGRRSAERLPRASRVSEWSRLAVLRTDWSPRAARLTVAFDSHRILGEFQVGEFRLWSGDCSPEVRIDGACVNPSTEYEVVCSFHDKDVEYVELQCRFGNEWKLQRQMMLALRDEFLLIADALIGPRRAAVEHAFTLPAPTRVDARLADASREGAWMVDGKRRAWALPIGLPEWRAEPSTGELIVHDGGLTLSSRSEGRAVFCPLFIDFSKHRRDLARTWRRLTVAEDRTRLPPDRAAGFRVRIGKEQWLIYRSLDKQACRSVLGQHLLPEFVVGRFPGSGQLDVLIQIEAADG